MINLTWHKQSIKDAPTLVLLHAFPFSSTMWRELIELLHDIDNGIVSIDMPGFNATPNHTWSMQGVAHELMDILASEDIHKPVLCGLSMGGYIALAVAKEYPLEIRGLILADTKSAADSEEVKQDREKFARDAIDRGAIAAVERNLLKMTSETTRRERPEVATAIQRWMMTADPQAIANALRAMADREDTTDVLRNLEIPILLIVGELDPVTPLAEMEKMKLAARSASLVRISEASHMSVTESPEEFATAVREYLTVL